MFPASLGSAIRTAILFVGLAALALLAGTVIAFAQSRVSISGSILDIGPTDQPGGVAEITLQNRNVNDGSDNGDYVVSFDGITATVEFSWNETGTADTIRVDPGPDHLAVPPLLDVDEDTTGRIVIYPLRAVGM